MRKGLRLAGAACGALLVAETCVSHAQASLLDGVSPSSKLPVVEVLGCRLHGLAVVCGAGPLLPKRLRKKERYYKEEVEPSDQSAKSPSSKGSTASKNEGSHPSQSLSVKTTTVHPATEEESAGAHACPPGDIVLAKPDASGSYCAPAGQNAGAAAAQSAGPTITDKVTSPAPTANDASSQSQTGGAAASSTAPPTPSTGSALSQSSNGGTSALGTAASAPTQSSGSFCCSAPTTSNGQPAASLQACGTDQSSALTAIVSAATQKNVTLGNVQCGAQ